MSEPRKMNTSDFKELADIGQGSYSEIQLVRELPTRALRALKVVSIKRGGFQSEINQTASIYTENFRFMEKVVSISKLGYFQGNVL